MTRRPDVAPLAEARAFYQRRRQFFFKAQFARSAPGDSSAGAGVPILPPGPLTRCARAVARLLVGVAALSFLVWALLDALSVPTVARAWPTGRCVRVDPPWTCAQLPARYTTTWVSPWVPPEAGR